MRRPGWGEGRAAAGQRPGRADTEIQAKGRRALAVACHVGHWKDCDALADRAYGHFGQVDVLVNNAGMSPLAPSSEGFTSIGALPPF